MTKGQGIQFGMDGPQMTGTWINPQTGHKFTVRDCMFQDGQFVCITTDGQVLDYNTIQNYVQCNDNQGNAIEPPKDMQKPNTSILTKGLGSLNDAVYVETPQVDPDQSIIERVLDVCKTPQIEAQIEWEVPQKEIETLIGILKVEPSKISKYYIDRLDKSTIFEHIKDTLTKYIEKLIDGTI